MKAIWELCFGDVSSIIFNVLIIAAGIIIILQLAARKKELEAGLVQIRKTFEVKHKKYTTDSEGLPTISSDSGYINEEDVLAQKRRFEEQCAGVDTLVQLIPVFPSLGILGTVVGLMMQISAEGIDGMTGAIATALSSTLFALIMTIILKAYTALKVSRTINETEIEFADHDRYHQEFIELRKQHTKA